MAENENRRIMSELQNKMEGQELHSMVVEIRDTLISINKSDQTIQKLMKRQEDEAIKKKTEDAPETAEFPMPEEYTEPQTKEIGALRKVFNDSFASIKDTFTPGGLFKSFGLLSGSPIFMLIGDKLDSLLSSYKEARVETREAREQQVQAQEKATENDFLREQNRDEELELMQQQNELLQDIKDKEFSISDENKKSFFDMIKTPLAFLSRVLPASILKVFSGGVLGKMLGRSLGIGGVAAKTGVKGVGRAGRVAPKAGRLLGGAGKLLKGGARILGKAALPLALVSGGFDFFQGFRKSLEITGREDLASKIQAGMSEVVSGLTFGIIDAKAVSGTIDKFKEKAIEFFKHPIDTIKKLINTEKIFESVTKFLSKISFGLFTPEQIKETFTSLKDKVVNFFTAPGELLKDLIDGENIGESILKAISSLTFGIISRDNIKNVVGFFKDHVSKIFMTPINWIKEQVTDIGSFWFNQISGAINSAKENITSFFSNVWSSIKENMLSIDFIGLFEQIKLPVDKLKDKVTEFKELIIGKIQGLLNLIVDPFKAIGKMFENLPGFSDLGGMLFGPSLAADGVTPDVMTFDDLRPSHRANENLQTIEREIVRTKEIERQKEMIREKKIADQTVNNNVVQSTQNNILVQEDMNTRTDDREWLKHSQF